MNRDVQAYRNALDAADALMVRARRLATLSPDEGWRSRFDDCIRQAGDALTELDSLVSQAEEAADMTAPRYTLAVRSDHVVLDSEDGVTDYGELKVRA